MVRGMFACKVRSIQVQKQYSNLDYKPLLLQNLDRKSSQNLGLSGQNLLLIQLTKHHLIL